MCIYSFVFFLFFVLFSRITVSRIYYPTYIRSILWNAIDIILSVMFFRSAQKQVLDMRYHTVKNIPTIQIFYDETIISQRPIKICKVVNLCLDLC